MVKTPEQYLSGLSFAPPVPDEKDRDLNYGERAFVEKYLGLDSLGMLPRLEPEPVAIPALPSGTAFRPVIVAEPEIQVAAPELKVAEPEICVVEAQPETVKIGSIAPEPEPVDAVAIEDVDASSDVSEPASSKAVAAPVISNVVAPETAVAEVAEAPFEAVQAEPAVEAVSVRPAIAAAAAPETAEISLRERLRQESEIQMVSFYVAGQLFLLPVEGIQEVLRHMELVKVPQAPDFVAGAINLRGHVTPLVYLSALLTRERSFAYNESNFIIICGSDSLRLGLIIDKVNSMHMLPQDKIIWNPESKLGDSVEYLYAIANLDDRVCGIVAPEMITQKILSG